VHLLFVPAILTRLHVTLRRGMHTPRQKGLVTPGLALACSKAFPLYFHLHRTESKPNLFLQFKTILSVFAVVLQNMAMCIYPDQDGYSSSGCLLFGRVNARTQIHPYKHAHT